MRTTFKYKDVTWVDLENPTQEEAREIIDEFGVAPIVANELLSPTLRPRVDAHQKFIYLILHFPSATSPHADDATTKHTNEINFVLGKNFIITTHYNPIDTIDDFSKVFEVNSILDKSDMGDHAGYVFFYMIRDFYKQMLNRVEVVRDFMDDTESRIFHGEERQMVQEISRINRILLTFRESLSTHKEVLESFEIAGQNFYGEKFKYHLRSIVGEYYKVATSINNTREYLNELRDTNDSLLSTKQNEIMKTLTIMAFVTFPLSLLAAIFGMNTVYTPFIGKENDFLIIVILMLILTFIMFIFFRVKKWL